MKKNKKGQLMMVGIGILVVLGIAFLALALLGKFGIDFGKGALSLTGEEDEILDASQISCPDDGKTTVYVKLQDDYANGVSYITGTERKGNLIFYDVTKSIIVGNTNSSAGSWSSQDVDCGDTIIVYAQADDATAGSARTAEFTANGDTMYKTLHTGSLSKMTVKVKDVDADAFVYLTTDGQTITGNTTGGVDMNTTNVWNSTMSGTGGDFPVGEDGSLDLQILVKSATQRKYGSDVGELNGIDEKSGTRLDFKNYMCIDVGTDNEWDSDEIVVTVNGGSALSNVISQIDDDSSDYTWIQNSEVCYDIGDIEATYKTIGFYVKAKAGQNPDTTNDDIKIYFLGEGFYESDDLANTIKTGIFTDASTQAGVLFSLTGDQPYININIA